jgi:hypothetical protein
VKGNKELTYIMILPLQIFDITHYLTKIKCHQFIYLVDKPGEGGGRGGGKEKYTNLRQVTHPQTLSGNTPVNITMDLVIRQLIDMVRTVYIYDTIHFVFRSGENSFHN